MAEMVGIVRLLEITDRQPLADGGDMIFEAARAATATHLARFRDDGTIILTPISFSAANLTPGQIVNLATT